MKSKLSKEMETAVNNLLNSLTPREEKVLKMYLPGKNSIPAIAKHFDVPEGRIEQIIAKAHRKLHDESRKPLVDEIFRLFGEIEINGIKFKTLWNFEKQAPLVIRKSRCFDRETNEEGFLYEFDDGNYVEVYDAAKSEI